MNKYVKSTHIAMFIESLHDIINEYRLSVSLHDLNHAKVAEIISYLEAFEDEASMLEAYARLSHKFRLEVRNDSAACFPEDAPRLAVISRFEVEVKAITDDLAIVSSVLESCYRDAVQAVMCKGVRTMLSCPVEDILQTRAVYLNLIKRMTNRP